MYEVRTIKGVDYYSLLINEKEDFESLDELNDYRVRMGVYYQKFIEQISYGLSENNKASIKDWFEFNKDFIGFVENTELLSGLESILLNLPKQ